MSSREFAAWLAYDAIEPIGARHDDHLTALLSAVLININRDPKADPVEVADLVPPWGWEQVRQARAVVGDDDPAPFERIAEPEPDAVDWTTLLAWVGGVNAAMGGKDLRNGLVA